MAASTNHLPRLPAALLALALCAACGREVDAAAAPPAAATDEFALEESWRSLGSATPRNRSELEAKRSDGPVTLWHAGGSKAGEGELRGGEKSGPWSFWYESGALRWRGTFENGLPHGPERGWYANGQLHFEGTLDRGRRSGLYRYWQEDGRPELEAEFLDDQLNGPCRRWTLDGVLDPLASGRYERGRKVGEL